MAFHHASSEDSSPEIRFFKIKQKNNEIILSNITPLSFKEKGDTCTITADGCYLFIGNNHRKTISAFNIQNLKFPRFMTEKKVSCIQSIRISPDNQNIICETGETNIQWKLSEFTELRPSSATLFGSAPLPQPPLTPMTHTTQGNTGRRGKRIT
jgi:hypothetical protein